MAKSIISVSYGTDTSRSGCFCYFITTDKFNFIKIGTTSNIIQRMTYWRGYHLFGVTEGYYDREAELHHQWNSHRFGNTEYFRPDDVIIEWILRNTHLDVPGKVWEFVKPVPRYLFHDLLNRDCVEFVPVNKLRPVYEVISFNAAADWYPVKKPVSVGTRSKQHE